MVTVLFGRSGRRLEKHSCREVKSGIWLLGHRQAAADLLGDSVAVIRREVTDFSHNEPIVESKNL